MFGHQEPDDFRQISVFWVVWGYLSVKFIIPLLLKVVVCELSAAGQH